MLAVPLTPFAALPREPHFVNLVIPLLSLMVTAPSLLFTIG